MSIVSTISDKETWDRPFTTKRYLHPPYAEELAIMWAQFAFLLGDIYDTGDFTTPAAGIRFLYSENDNPFDFKTVKYETRDDGIPVHAYSYDMGDWSVRAESFCNIKVSPTIFIKLKIKNKGLWNISDTLGMIVRTGHENIIHGMHDPDGYTTFNPNYRSWGILPRTWRFENGFLTDDKYTVSFSKSDSANVRWQGEEKGLPWHRRGILKFDFNLLPGEECEITLALKKGETENFDYEEEKEKVLKFWEGELLKIKKFPGGEAFKPMIKNFVSQNLQMFAHHVGKYDYVLPRQGCTQRKIWVCEAYRFLKALDRIGDFYSYTERAYDLFYGKLFETEGEDYGRINTLSKSIPWGGITGSAMCGVSYHILTRGDKKVFDKFKDKIYASFEWIERQRAKTGEVEGSIPGLMPPMQASDWPEVNQVWLTDYLSCEGMIEAAKCFKQFGDERADRMLIACEDYKKAIKTAVCDTPDYDENEFLIGPKANIKGLPLEDPFVSSMSTSLILFADIGVIDQNSELIIKHKNYLRNRNIIQNGLHLIMHACAETSHTPMNGWIGYCYYTTFIDFAWFEHYLAIGDKENAYEVLKGQLKFSMSPEYQCVERYSANDRYFVPWQPNASANGRIIDMLFSWYGEE